MSLYVFQICEYYGTRRVPRSLWVNNRTSAWWEKVVPTYTNVQWIKDFRMSKGSFQLLCIRLEATLGRRDTNNRECVPVPKKIAGGQDTRTALMRHLNSMEIVN